MTDVSALELLAVDLIDHHPANPRHQIGDIAELAESIRLVGVLQPISVYREGGRFVCLMGNRRLAAARKAGLEAVPALVWGQMGPEHQMVAMLVENLQRIDLNPMDEAEGFAALALAGMDQAEIGARVGKSQSSISRRMRLLELDEESQAKVRTGALSARAALASLEPKKERPRSDPGPKRADDVLDAMYGDAAPMVRDVQAELLAALEALVDQRLPSAAAHIANAHRALFPVVQAPSWIVTDEDDAADVLAEAESVVEERPARAHNPVAALGEAIAASVARRDGHPPGPVQVTIGPPDGSFATRLVECAQHGRLTRTPELDFARSKAQAHIDEKHAGAGEVVVGEDVAS